MPAQYNNGDLFFDRKIQVEIIQNYQATIPKGAEYGDVSILNELYDAHRKSIRKSAIHWSQITKAAVEDLEQEGYFAFLKAAEQFDPNRGTIFNTYLLIKCRQRMTIEGPHQVGPVSMERNAVYKADKIHQFQHTFYADNRRYPTTDEIAAGTHLSKKTIEGLDSQLRTPLYLGQMSGFEPSEVQSALEKISMQLHGTQSNPESQANIESMLNCLNPEERDVVSLRYLTDTRNIGHREIAKILEFSSTKVHALDKSALATLREKAA